MSDLTIRPTAKFIMVRFILTALVFAGLESVYFYYWKESDGFGWVPWVVPVIFVPVLLRVIRRRFTTVTITGDRLRYEPGLFSKSTRTIQLSKVQDVRVDQHLAQRMVGVGDLSIETAGEASRLTYRISTSRSRSQTGFWIDSQKGPGNT